MGSFVVTFKKKLHTENPVYVFYENVPIPVLVTVPLVHVILKLHRGRKTEALGTKSKSFGHY
jgi:hypothetical protein